MEQQLKWGDSGISKDGVVEDVVVIVVNSGKDECAQAIASIDVGLKFGNVARVSVVSDMDLSICCIVEMDGGLPGMNGLYEQNPRDGVEILGGHDKA